MKYTLFSLFLIATLANLCSALQLKKLPSPPRANDLADHFGTNPSANVFGPRGPVLGQGQLMRQGMNSGVPFKPITNFDLEIDPKLVVGGDLTNTAPDAEKIINPPLASIIIFKNKRTKG